MTKVYSREFTTKKVSEVRTAIARHVTKFGKKPDFVLLGFGTYLALCQFMTEMTSGEISSELLIMANRELSSLEFPSIRLKAFLDIEILIDREIEYRVLTLAKYLLPHEEAARAILSQENNSQLTTWQQEQHHGNN